jgi:dephospho-CoA kinase
MIRVALTGNIGSGKSTVSKIFNSLGIPVFIADLEAKLLYDEEPVKKIIKKEIGISVFGKDGEVDLKLLADRIFNNKNALLKINKIIHPLTLEKYQLWLKKYKGEAYTLHESAILFENNLQRHFDKIINVSAPLELRLKRVIERDGTDEKKVRERMQNQLPDEDKNKMADFVVVNDGNQFLIPQIIKIDKKLKDL